MGTRKHRQFSCTSVLLGGCLGAILLFSLSIYLLTTLFHLELPFQSVYRNYDFDLRTGRGLAYNSEFTWKYVDNNLNRYEARLNLKIPERDFTSAMQFIADIGEASYEELGLKEFTDETDSLSVAREVWFLIYQKVARFSKPQLRVLNQKLDSVFNQENMSMQDRLLYLSTFVQNIDYKIPSSETGILPPIGTLVHRFGDCDTKALLLYILLEHQGIDCVVMWSGYYTHAMLGVAVPASGDYKRVYSRNYYFLEVTSPDWMPGQLPPDVSNPDFWLVFNLSQSS